MALRFLALVSLFLFVVLSLTGVAAEVAFIRSAVVFVASFFIYRMYMGLAGVVKGAAESDEEEDEEAAENQQGQAGEAATADSQGTEADSVEEKQPAEQESADDGLDEPGAFPGQPEKKKETEPEKTVTGAAEASQSAEDNEEESSTEAEDNQPAPPKERLRDEVEEMAGTPEAAEVVREIMEERNRRRRKNRQKQDEENAYS